VDVGEQASDAVGQSGGILGEVVVVTDENVELGEGVVADIDAAQRVRHRACGVSDDVGVLASVLADPGCRSAMRRIASPGR
jgi:hypothetical protein